MPDNQGPNASSGEVQGAQQQQQDGGPPSGVQDCPLTKTWVEFQLVDMEGNPVPRKRYKIKDPGGALKEGSLDANGSVRLDGIPQGTCTISFPEFDAEAWERV